jgi:hypothetical protein
VSEIAANAAEPRWSGLEPKAWLCGLALAVIADLLFWQHEPGMSLFVFFVAVNAAIHVIRGARTFEGRLWVAVGVALLGALPLVEALSWWGFLSATFGAGFLALAASRQMPASLLDLPGRVLRFGVLAPFRFIADFVNAGFSIAERGTGRTMVRGLLMWVMPLVLAVVFVGLFSAANPLIESALIAIRLDAVAGFFGFWRIVLWVFALCFVWPFLAPRLLAIPAVAEMHGPHLPKAESILFGQGAILRALMLFNALFAVQTVLDIAYLWGGVALPDGMTYADYAHRGAYPLVATALLAAAFVLAAMRPDGPATKSPLIRNLVYAFIAQNVMLVVSSILRLDLYVEVYSLTELRVAAGIWMGLVAIGLVLILVRIALGKTNKWLVGSNLLSLGLTLYACAWVDWSAIIARFNVEHSYELTGQGTKLDIGYLWNDLGPSAIPALDLYLEGLKAKGATDFDRREADVARDELAVAFMKRPEDWQRWTFRDERLRAYLIGEGYFAEFPGTDRTQETMP